MSDISASIKLMRTLLAQEFQNTSGDALAQAALVAALADMTGTSIVQASRGCEKLQDRALDIAAHHMALAMKSPKRSRARPSQRKD